MAHMNAILNMEYHYLWILLDLTNGIISKYMIMKYLHIKTKQKLFPFLLSYLHTQPRLSLIKQNNKQFIFVHKLTTQNSYFE